MTLEEILAVVKNSSPSDWHKHSEAESVFAQNIDISLDWTETINSSFSEDWHKGLHDPKASLVSVVLRYNGNIVDRWKFVDVDGGRYLMPLPRHATGTGYELSSSMLPLGKLLFDLYPPGGPINTLTDLLKVCKIAIV